MRLKPRLRSAQRIMARDGEMPTIVRLGEVKTPWRDLYHRLLRLSWPAFVLVLALSYLAINALFALAYLARDGGIANARPGSFLDALFFSVQTMASIGYGAMYPQTNYANWLVILEAFIGLLLLAMATGLCFARFSLPRSRVVFSQYAVVAPTGGVPTLMFRAANQRRNRILEARLWVTLVRDETTAEGEFFRRFYDLLMVRAQTPLFALSWTAMHAITPDSPLYGETSASLAAVNAEIVIILTGMDETLSQTIHARHSFLAEEILWNHRFVDILGQTPDGRRSIDYRNFHQVKSLGDRR
ncbi:ATP-sensitive inward rectifier potassium channel 10 [filamentous cyanobacterium CCT1]|nr:ATP-sensitive inward rectifier potassium channel 10 [filamentous cyanobacterium CCT1]PSN80260.1 ATP-sensitive inward rectifier potassium channel 10 [filamentous cyanobacterium CCP4]